MTRAEQKFYADVARIAVALERIADAPERIADAPGGRHGDTTEPGIGLPIGDAASYLGVSQSALRRWADDGAVTCHRTPGGQRRFTVESLDRLRG